MTRTLAVDSHRVALDLHALLRETDPVRWRDELEAGARERLAYIQAQLGQLLESGGEASERPAAPVRAEPEASAVHALQDRMAEVHQLIGELAPPAQAPSDARREAWMELHRALMPAYESLAAALRDWSLPVPGAGPTPPHPVRLATPTSEPSMPDPSPGDPTDQARPGVPPPEADARPTNYVRNVFHVLNAVGVLLLVQYVLVTRELLVGVAFAGFVWAWSMEIGRRLDARINRFLMWVFGPVAHPHEAQGINSATWFTTALLVLALTFDRVAGVAALAVLGFGDPMAALVGRRFGRVRLVNGRSLEGTSAFVAVGALAAFAVLRIWHADLPPGDALVVALAAALCGAVAELLTRRIDDNFAIPVVAAAGASLALGVLV